MIAFLSLRIHEPKRRHRDACVVEYLLIGPKDVLVILNSQGKVCESVDIRRIEIALDNPLNKSPNVAQGLRPCESVRITRKKMIKGEQYRFHRCNFDSPIYDGP